MNSRWIAVAGALLVALVPITAQDAVSVSVWPEVALEPANVRVRVNVEPNPDNRALEVIAESVDFFRRSYIDLDGDRASRTREFEYRGLPAGEYEVRAAIFGPDGQEAVAVAKLQIGP